MFRKKIATLAVLMFVAGVFLYAASGKMFIRYSTHESVEPAVASTHLEAATPQQTSGSTDRRMVDMTADDSYLIEKGDSTIFILVGHFAAHHNGAVILADSAVRYSNQSFECFGNVLINQNSTYIYGERAEYNRNNNTAKVFSKLVKVVDEDAVMYTYDCEFNTAKSLGAFSGGCYAQKGENQLEADRGFYNTKTHELKAIDRVQMRDSTYKVLSDSVIFNTHTEDAQYFTNTHIWNDKDEYLYADAGTYTKRSDLHHLTNRAYLLSPEREIWSDSIMYYRTDGHIIARRNIQVDDTTQKMLGFADYAEWWDEPGNALFTRRPSMINYDPELTDSLYLSADTLWLYTIAVLPESEVQDSTERATQSEQISERTDVEQGDDAVTTDEHRDTTSLDQEVLVDETTESKDDSEATHSESRAERGDKGKQPQERGDRAAERGDKRNRGRDSEQADVEAQRPRDGQRVDPTANNRPMPRRDSSTQGDSLELDQTQNVDTTAMDSASRRGIGR
jgi:lipopolysaccharide export system protein LptA